MPRRGDFGEKVGEAVVAWFKARGVDASLHECHDWDDTPDGWSVNLGVEPGTVERMYREKSPDVVVVEGRTIHVTVSFEPRVPPMVKAKLGDWVLIYSRTHDEDEWGVGLVTSMHRQGRKVAYGVRHVKPSSWLDRTGEDELFVVTGEEYDGLPGGFVKVLTEKEALDAIEKKVIESAKRKIKAIRKAMGGIRNGVRRAVKGYEKEVVTRRLRKDDLTPRDPLR